MRDEPDLFNPLWINVTWAFCLCIIINISRYIKSEARELYEFDFSVVPSSFGMIFAFACFIPFILLFLLLVNGKARSFKDSVTIIAVYSYANIFFVIGSIFTLIPINFNLLIVILSVMCSLWFLYINYISITDDISQKFQGTIIAILFLLQIVVSITYYLSFFN